MDQHHLHTPGQSEGLWDWNLASNRIHFSPGWLSLLGCEGEIGSTPEAWLRKVHPDDLGPVSRAIETHLSDGPDEFDVRHRMLHANGSYRWMSCRGVVQRDGTGRAVRVLGSHADITVQTVTDPLTGLPNELLLAEHLRHSIERAQRYPGFYFAVLIVDLDRPPPPHGAPAPATADPLLMAAARRLETGLRIGDSPPSFRHNDLVARLEGDQFAILLDGLKEIGHSTVVAERILAGILAPFTLGGREVRVAASMGIAVSVTGYSRADDVVRDARTALHRAKILGKARYEVFDTAGLRSAQVQLQLEADCTGALERREFQLYYQPIVSLDSRQIVGLEALVRWQHPILGTIPPLDFIPLAEKTGFIVPLGAWILREACLQLKTWQDTLPGSKDLWMSANLSSLQFKHPKLVEQVGEALRDSALEARSLVLELTEGVAMENPAAVKTILMQLRALGVRISVDDFGTGHSSLAYLRQFPVDSLKVDRSFIRGIEDNEDMVGILGAIMAMAQHLGLYVVAEGIELEEQMALARSLRCEYGQGYLFAKPLDRDKAAALLVTGLPASQDSTLEREAAGVLRLGPHAAESEQGPRGQGALRWAAGVAAGLLLLASVGLPARLAQGPPLPPLPPPPALGRAELSVPAGPPAGTQGLPGTLGMVAGSGMPPIASGVERQNGREADSAGSPAAGVAGPLASLRVVHQHLLGGCVGLLVVSRDGVAFVPDRGQAQDAFAFKHTDFLYILESSSLVIKSSNRDYRFMPERVSGRGDDQFSPIVAGMARFR